jgi:ribulose-phosphate 3-epimerase
MIDIVPAILTDSEDEFVRLVRELEAAGVSRVHLDIADGVFVPTKTILGYQELARLNTNIAFDVHLMVQNPQEHWEEWCSAPHTDRLLVHIETTPDFSGIADKAHACSRQLGAVLNPETPLADLEGVLQYADTVQFMAVHPGRQGSPFIPEALERIRLFVANHPGTPIIVDGGVTPETAPACAAAGATVLVSGSYIVQHESVTDALASLRASLSRET